ncbi:hydantoinase B/oxoprolinase family protein [Bradyrhizobium sp. Leo170]|uniref:hydantoinase B/oxoprolinase family protein n=1 Tax=Bradyrhizobium sp. Leo170 TaxID=1571199 RepID=UPI00102E688D|nr:hydantoinase B/oxoprolinase family protein [Bradyrhizobium sp. Leo170]TAI65901.1 hypothetical protein CWO89_10960 [Bradyrhizobium sp. Leo170]
MAAGRDCHSAAADRCRKGPDGRRDRPPDLRQRPDVEVGRGDFYAQLAANRTGIERLQQLAERHGYDLVVRAMAETLDYTERRMRAAIATIPNGTWTGEAWIDADVRGDIPLKVVATVTVADGAMVLDFTGTAPEVHSMFNSSKSSSIAAAISAVRCLLADKDIPANDACNRLIDIRLPEGTIVNPMPGRPVRARIAVSYRVLDAIHEALGKAIPDRVPAQGFNSTTGLYLVQERPNGGTRIYADVLGGGYGGAPGYDGAHALAGVLSSSRNTPIESIEQIHPHIRMLRYGLVPNSGGAGEWRGGLGFTRAIQVLEDNVVLSYYSEHFLYPARGRMGGADGALASLKVIRGKDVIDLPTTAVMTLQKGDIVQLTVGGGAGWGDPAKRPVELVERDLEQGLITAEFATRHYPQAFKPALVA